LSVSESNFSLSGMAAKAALLPALRFASLNLCHS